MFSQFNKALLNCQYNITYRKLSSQFNTECFNFRYNETIVCNALNVGKDASLKKIIYELHMI